MIRWQSDGRDPVSRQRLKRASILGSSIVAMAAVTVPVLTQHTPFIVYNASASLPIGYYQMSRAGTVKVGDLVLLHTPETVRLLADHRRYLPRSVPMMKYVAALHGDVVCAIDETIVINGKRVAIRQRTDRMGRPMPWWSGCHLLAKDEALFLNSEAPTSFDGRYFGIVKLTLVIGKLRRL